MLKTNVTRKLALVMSLAIIAILCLAPTTTVSAAAGGYTERTYYGTVANEVFTLVPGSYASRAQLTLEIKNISSSITSVWVEATNSRTGSRIWSGFLDEMPNDKATAWFDMQQGDRINVRVHSSGSGQFTVAASLWSN